MVCGPWLLPDASACPSPSGVPASVPPSACPFWRASMSARPSACPSRRASLPGCSPAVISSPPEITLASPSPASVSPSSDEGVATHGAGSTSSQTRQPRAAGGMDAATASSCVRMPAHTASARACGRSSTRARRCSSGATSACRRGDRTSTATPSFCKRSATTPPLAISTTSGCSAATLSTLKLPRLPSFGSVATCAGQLEKRSTPTSRSQACSTQTDSVSAGESDTTRRTRAGRVTVIPRSSFSARSPACARSSRRAWPSIRS